MHQRHLSLLAAGSLAGLLAMSSCGIGAQGQPDFFLDPTGDGGGAGGSTGGGNNGGGQGNQGGNGNAPTLEQLQARLTQLEGERDTLKTERDDFKGKLDADEATKLSETGRLKKEAADAKAEADTAREAVKQARAEVAVTREAAKVGIDAALAIRLVTVEFDKDGQPKDVDKALKVLAESHPELVKAAGGPTGGGSSNPPRPRGSSDGQPKPMNEALAAHYAKN